MPSVAPTPFAAPVRPLRWPWSPPDMPTSGRTAIGRLAFNPLLALQGLIGNAGVLDLLRSSSPGGLREDQTSPRSSALSRPGLSASPPEPSALSNPTGATEANQASWWNNAVDSAVGGVDSLVVSGVNALSDDPVLRAVAATQAPATKFNAEVAGGTAKGMGDMVGGLANIAAHPINTLVSLDTMAEHIPGIGAPFQAQHMLYDLIEGNRSFEDICFRNPIDVIGEGLVDDYDYWTSMRDAMAEPYKQAIEQGRYGEALGRGIFDIGAFFLGGGEAKSLGEGAEAIYGANKVDDAVKLASRATELGTTADDIAQVGNKAEAVTKGASYADEAADLGNVDDATKLANQTGPEVEFVGPKGDDAATVATSAEDDDLVKIADPRAQPDSGVTDQAENDTQLQGASEGESVTLERPGPETTAPSAGPDSAAGGGTDHLPSNDSPTSEATRLHVHEGGTVTDPQSPYFGRWDGGGIHDWDGLVGRCAEDGFRLVDVKEDPVSGVRRVIVERSGISPRTGEPISGNIKKTL